MATIVLTVAGSILGGPVGAAIGSMIGGIVDREVLFKPKGREGPRLTELRVQTSSYGTQIPKIFGTMRVGGSVIWATDLIEHRSTQSGKGRPSTTSYSYTASFAVALSSRPILGVGRIWADGKLLRGAAGDFKARTGFRLYRGDEAQMPDPLIAAAEGLDLAPAHRGIAYAVFEELELGDYGNRIPSLSFEVIGDAEPVAAGAIAAEIGKGSLVCEDNTVPLAGFAATGASTRAVVETLAGASGGWFRADQGALTLLSGGGAATLLQDAGAGDAPHAVGRRDIAAPDAAPCALTLAYYEPERDYQVGLQRAVRPGAGARQARMELAAAVDAAGGKAIAQAALLRLDIERERRTLALPWSALAVRPGERVTIADAPGLWRIDRWRLENMVLLFECLAVAQVSGPAEATGGRVLAAPDLTAGDTIVHAFELPLVGPSATAPRLAIAAGGTGPGWRSAGLSLSIDEGATWSSVGTTAAPAVLGQIVAPPGPASAALADRINTLVVELGNGGMLLHDADDAALAAGSNLAVAGDELLQFAHAVPLGARRWKLGGLWRGRRGTEAAIGTQAAGDRFVLVAADTLATIDLPLQAVGGVARIAAHGTDDGSAEAIAEISGLSLVPPSPVHLREFASPEGGIEIRWVRRSRNGWDWVDGVDAPLGEEAERYAVTLALRAGGEETFETSVTRLRLEDPERAEVAAVTIRQIGSFGLSPPATIELPLIGEI